jgi:hypothetical protein
MERLTNNVLKVACDSFISFGSREERTKYRMLAEAAPKYEEIYKKLAEYENLEEKLIAHTGMNFKEWLKHTTSMFD